MHYSRLQVTFYLVLLIASLLLLFFIFRPFLDALVLAFAFAVVFHSVNTRIVKALKGRAALASLLTILFLFVVILIPLAYLTSVLLDEARGLYAVVASNGGGSSVIDTIVGNLETYLRTWFPDMTIHLSQYVQEGLRWVVSNLDSFFSGFVKVLLTVFIMLIALFYLFRDGEKLRKKFIYLSPLANVHDESILDKLAAAFNSVIKGSLVIAIVQGILAALGLFIFGVPNPVLWGFVATIAGLIPGAGTALVTAPAILYLFFVDREVAAVGLLTWAIIVVGLVDNFLTPYLIQRGLHIHPFLILISVLGGLIFFGPIGFLLGPLTLSLFFSLLDIYPLMIGSEQHD